MSTPQIAIIDDNINAFDSATRSLKSGETLAWSTPIHDDSGLAAWKAWCEKAAPEELILILDLGLQEGRSKYKPFETSANVLREEMLTEHDIALLNGQSATDGFAAGIIAASAERIKKLLIVIASGRGRLGEIKSAMEKFAATKSRGPATEVCFSRDNATLVSYASVVIAGAKDEWGKRFPNWHVDSAINRMIHAYGKPWLHPADFSSVNHKAWSHDACASQPYKDHAATIIDVKSLGDEEVKSLCMCSEAVLFHVEKPSRLLTRTSLISSLKRIEIEASVQDEGLWQLPAMPGLAFLFSLKNLLSELEKEAPANRVEFKAQKISEMVSQYVLRIELASIRTHSKRSVLVSPYDHACRFLEKAQQSKKPDEEIGGLSGAIKNLTRSKVTGIRNDAKLPWLNLFQVGCECPIVQPSFHPHALEFVWGKPSGTPQL